VLGDLVSTGTKVTSGAACDGNVRFPQAQETTLGGDVPSTSSLLRPSRLLGARVTDPSPRTFRSLCIPWRKPFDPREGAL